MIAGEFYNVGEMDGCDEECEYVVGEIARRAEEGDSEAIAATGMAAKL